VFILVIEDDADLVARLYDFFEARGHVVDAAYDGHTGHAFAVHKPYDVVVLDVGLPGMDGIELCRRLRERGRKLPVLMISARAALKDKLDGFAAGSDDYLTKPFALEELEARVLALVRRARCETGQEPLRVADLELDPATLRVTRGGRPIVLPPIPLKLLELLMRQSPRVVTRRELERRIWGNDRPETDALRAHIHTLRSAMDRPFDVPLLRTVHGIGYQIAAPEARRRIST
jgi:DNA-binding response OmpR family regulator